MTDAPGWVQRELGVRLVDDSSGAEPLSSLVEVALRRNPRRAHLLVSAVLGKHVPTPPADVIGAGRRLAARVAGALDGVTPGLVLGYAETATALGHLVAVNLGAAYLHSTRRRGPDVARGGGFEEPHSHAPAHQLAPDDPQLLSTAGPVVLVDDEVSTGRTALNTIAALQQIARRNHYVLAALVDVRSQAERDACVAEAAASGIRLDVVSLASGRIELPVGTVEAAARIVATVPESTSEPSGTARPAEQLVISWPSTRDGGRHGCQPTDHRALAAAAESCARDITAAIDGDRVLVLGHEEFMYAPLLIADALSRRTDATVLFSTTTRSPVVVIDEPGYPIRSGLGFPSCDEAADGPGPRFAYNVAPHGASPGFSDVVLVVDSDADTPALHAPGGLLEALAAVADRVHVVVVPAYRPALVGSTT